jgi:poly-gamma-glutamate synthesis protein (capsule biosynthesis protein)
VRRLVPLVAVLLAVAGCSGVTPSGQAVRPANATVPPTQPPSAVITLAFGGDVHFTGRTLALLDDLSSAFGPVAQTLRAADLAMVNLETAVTLRGTPAEKEYTFRAPPAAFAALRAAGVDVATLANNHGMDYGPVGFADTLAAASAAGFPLVGAGANAAAAYAPWVITVKGVRIAVLAFTQIATFTSTWPATDTRPGLAYALSPSELAAAVDAVRAARAQADVVIVYMHWGEERESCPTALQRSTAQAFASAGATLVVGAHPHIPQGMGWLGGTFVAYSLGNFLWYSDTSNPDTGVLRVSLAGSSVLSTEYLPATISPRTGQPLPVSGAEHDRILAKIDGLRACTGLAAARS